MNKYLCHCNFKLKRNSIELILTNYRPTGCFLESCVNWVLNPWLLTKSDETKGFQSDTSTSGPCLTTTFLSNVSTAFLKNYILSRTLGNVSKSCENLPIRWADCVHIQFFRSCTTQSAFLLRPTTFSCHSANVLDDLQPSVLRPCTVLCVPLPSV